MRSLLLIDLSGIFWANWHATADQNVSGALDLTIEKITQLREGFDHAVICCDCPPYKRKDIAPSYKAQRDSPPPQAIELLRRVQSRLETDGLLIWKREGYEADDVIATAVAIARNEADPIEITIASGDKDLLQLVDDARAVRVLSPQSGKLYQERDVSEKFGVPPKLMVDLLALMGDKSDNIAGVPGVGPKNAAKLLEQFGTLEGVLGGAASIPQEKMRENVRTSVDAVRLALKLVTLDTSCPIDFDEIFAERAPRLLAEQTDDFDSDDDAEPEESGPKAAQAPATTPAPPVFDGELLPPPTPRPPAPIQREAAALGLGDLAARQVDTALAVTPTASYELALQPQSINAAFKLAVGLHNSRLYTRFPTPEAIMAVILRGREMGLSALTACDSFHVIEGKPAMHAHLIVARAKAHPDCEYFRFVEGDETFALYETKSRKNPEPTRLRYTIEQAKQAGLCPDVPQTRKQGNDRDRRGMWEKRPAEQLRKTCAVQLARIEYPDSALGLYAIEELEGAA